MGKVSIKRQITLPVEQCRSLGIGPGDEVESVVIDGQIRLYKRVKGSANAALSNLAEGKPAPSDSQALMTSVTKRHDRD